MNKVAPKSWVADPEFYYNMPEHMRDAVRRAYERSLKETQKSKTASSLVRHYIYSIQPVRGHVKKTIRSASVQNSNNDKIAAIFQYHGEEYLRLFNKLYDGMVSPRVLIQFVHKDYKVIGLQLLNDTCALLGVRAFFWEHSDQLFGVWVNSETLGDKSSMSLFIKPVDITDHIYATR